MPESTPKQPVELQINLEAAHNRFIIQINRLLQVMVFCFSGQELVNESNYGTYDRFIKFHDQNNKPDLKIAKMESESWLICHFLTDAANLSGLLLEDIRINCRILQLAKTKTPKGVDLDHILNEERNSFHSRDLPQKIEFLKNEFNVESVYSEHLQSLNRVRNCLAHRQGIVGKKDANEKGEMILKLYSSIFLAKFKNGREEIIDKPGYLFNEEGELCMRLENSVKIFKLGQKITFSHNDLNSLIITLIQLSSTLQTSVSNYGKNIGLL